MAEIKLTQGLVALVDDDDYEILSCARWIAAKRADGKYYARSSLRKIPMQRVLLKVPEGMVVDHINGDGLDNRRDNLRAATPKQNAANKIKTVKSNAGFKGVWYSEKLDLFRAYCGSGPQRYLGWFDDPVAAALAYDRRAVEMYGEFAALNFREDQGSSARERLRPSFAPEQNRNSAMECPP